MILEIEDKVESAIDEMIERAWETNVTSFLLLVARADTTEGLKGIVGTDCVTDYMGDLYRGETAERFYIRYMNTNYKKEGFIYQGEEGLDALSIEMMIYSHLWASYHFLKSLYRFGSIFKGQDYPWKINMESSSSGRWEWMNTHIIEPLSNSSLEIANIIKRAYSTDIRDAFAHALYSINSDRREIHLYPKRRSFVLKFDEFQEKFLNSSLLMYVLHQKMAALHNQYASQNACLTEPFLTPEGIKCQLFGKLIHRGDVLCPEFRIKKVL